ncbi:DUF4956 domain-containing protein [Agromyces seonyuensis]|uniref:DUF4956 domain-containing protein n=1 Tax=Agromyces seonyuensis TaxID=2662446 RepID=A0A6I4NZE1_9MICO|nr:DUF4956 domain-containing protein [Agromyces seonyuensis]MWB99686.1 DUF4956 domain-containing protein [Agromyces seonyuensis]
MTPLLFVAIDLVAIAVLVFAVYFPRHRRRDLVVSYLTVNVGVLAVSIVLSDAALGAGLGLGLFGVLSIIRLRSREIEQHEVGYYFAALALGLLGGLGSTLGWTTIALMALVVGVLAVADHPRLFRRTRQQLVQLDRAIADEAALEAHLAELLGARIHETRVERLDLVDDTTLVEVRYELRPDASGRGRTTAGTRQAAGGTAGFAGVDAGERR